MVPPPSFKHWRMLRRIFRTSRVNGYGEQFHS
jgi:hypothetical protein